MVDEFFAAYSIFGVFLKQALHETNGLRRQVLRKVYCLLLHVHNSVFRLLSPNVIEGSLAHQELVCQHAQAPQVYRVVVLFALEYFRGSVIESATAGTPSTVANSRPSEITDLAHSLN